MSSPYSMRASDHAYFVLPVCTAVLVWQAILAVKRRRGMPQRSAAQHNTAINAAECCGSGKLRKKRTFVDNFIYHI